MFFELLLFNGTCLFGKGIGKSEKTYDFMRNMWFFVGQGLLKFQKAWLLVSKPCFLGWLLPAKMKGGLKKSETPILWTFMIIYGHLGGSNVHKCQVKDIWEGANVYKFPGQDMVIGMSGRYIRNCQPRPSFVSPGHPFHRRQWRGHRRCRDSYRWKKP